MFSSSELERRQIATLKKLTLSLSLPLTLVLYHSRSLACSMCLISTKIYTKSTQKKKQKLCNYGAVTSANPFPPPPRHLPYKRSEFALLPALSAPLTKRVAALPLAGMSKGNGNGNGNWNGRGAGCSHSHSIPILYHIVRPFLGKQLKGRGTQHRLSGRLDLQCVDWREGVVLSRALPLISVCVGI